MAYDLARLEQALVNADKAGDVDAAKAFATEIRKMRGTQSAANATPSALGREEDTLQVWNPAQLWDEKATNFDTGINIGADVSNALAGAGKGFVDLGRRVGQVTGQVSESDIDEVKARDKALMNTKAGISGNIGANIAAMLPALAIPGVNTALGATMLGAGMGAMETTGTDDSTLRNIILGGGLGAAGYGAGKLLNKAASSAGRKVADIEAKVTAKAAEAAASETASARSAAGTAAQNAYRQLEHLRELKALRGLTPEEVKIAKELTKELAQKAQEKLIPAAALKKATAQSYQEAIASEADRAAKLAAEKLGTGEAKHQVMARLKRYGPAAVGGMIGNVLFPGLGGAVGGAATGLVLRPAIHSMRRLAQNPAVQRQMLMPLMNSEILNSKYLPLILAMAGPSVYAAKE